MDRKISAAARAGPMRSTPSCQTRPAGQRMNRSEGVLGLGEWQLEYGAQIAVKFPSWS
jgi:hypothetical protein